MYTRHRSRDGLKPSTQESRPFLGRTRCQALRHAPSCFDSALQIHSGSYRAQQIRNIAARTIHTRNQISCLLYRVRSRNLAHAARVRRRMGRRQGARSGQRGVADRVLLYWRVQVRYRDIVIRVFSYTRKKHVLVVAAFVFSCVEFIRMHACRHARTYR